MVPLLLVLVSIGLKYIGGNRTIEIAMDPGWVSSMRHSDMPLDQSTQRKSQIKKIINTDTSERKHCQIRNALHELTVTLLFLAYYHCGTKRLIQ